MPSPEGLRRKPSLGIGDRLLLLLVSSPRAPRARRELGELLLLDRGVVVGLVLIFTPARSGSSSS